MKHGIRSALVCLVLMSVQGAFAQDQADFRWSDLSGTWRGEGLLRATPQDALEQGVCRFEIAADGDQQMTITGRCASAAQTGQLSTELSRSSSGAITAVAQSPLLSEPALMTGTQNAGSIVLASDGQVSIDGRSYSISSQISGWTENGDISLVQRLAEGGQEPAIVLQMLFNRSN